MVIEALLSSSGGVATAEGVCDFNSDVARASDESCLMELEVDVEALLSAFGDFAADERFGDFNSDVGCVLSVDSR